MNIRLENLIEELKTKQCIANSLLKKHPDIGPGEARFFMDNLVEVKKIKEQIKDMQREIDKQEMIVYHILLEALYFGKDIKGARQFIKEYRINEEDDSRLIFTKADYKYALSICDTAIKFRKGNSSDLDDLTCPELPSHKMPPISSELETFE